VAAPLMQGDLGYSFDSAESAIAAVDAEVALTWRPASSSDTPDRFNGYDGDGQLRARQMTDEGKVLHIVL
jgi:hypothetical protein